MLLDTTGFVPFFNDVQYFGDDTSQNSYLHQ